MSNSDIPKECCLSCRYSRRVEGESVEMRCHRYAPAPITTIRAKAHWVYVVPDDWCGEYEPKPG